MIEKTIETIPETIPEIVESKIERANKAIANVLKEEGLAFKVEMVPKISLVEND